MKKYRFWICLAALTVVGIALSLRWGAVGILAFSVIYGLVMNIIPDEK